jgi:hypothetical protein
MSSSNMIRHAIFLQSGGRCECRDLCCNHPHNPFYERCVNTFSEDGQWELYALQPSDTTNSVGYQALCACCAKQAREKGGKRMGFVV